MPTATLRTSAVKQRRPHILREAMRNLIDFSTNSRWSRRQHEPGICDFTLGNPHELPVPGLVDALQTWAAPQNKDWFGYKMSEPQAQEVVAASLRERFGIAFEPADIAMTNGAFGAISTALKTVGEPGDEVIFSLPAWPLYEAMIREAGLVPVTVKSKATTFDLDLHAIADAITPRTRVVIVNTPNNPTGKIYSADTLLRLAALLEGQSLQRGEPIYILADEPYNRIVFDGKTPVSPAQFYPSTLIAYSYGKVLLAPGERIGYLAMPASMPDREGLREDIMTTQIASGWAFPNALLQHALADLESCSIDIERFQRKRDRMVNELRSYGYEVHSPEGTFYLMPKTPMDSDADFINLLADHDVFVLPGGVFGAPGYFRISLTANEHMIERSLPAFKEAGIEGASYDLVAALVNDGC